MLSVSNFIIELVGLNAVQGLCNNCNRKASEPAPPFEEHDIDDDWDASSVLFQVLGPPPKNVVIRRWKWDPEKKEHFLWVHPRPPPSSPSQEKVENVVITADQTQTSTGEGGDEAEVSKRGQTGQGPFQRLSRQAVVQ